MAEPKTVNGKSKAWAWPVGILLGLAIGVPSFGLWGVGFGIAIGIAFAIAFGATKKPVEGDTGGGPGGSDATGSGPTRGGPEGNATEDDATEDDAGGSRQG